MKKAIYCFILSLLCITAIGQQKNFEGILVYRVEVKSKSPIVSDRVMRNILALGNEQTIWIKQGNYKQVNSMVTSWDIAKDQRSYNKFPNIDTLYYLDYSFDTATIKNISRTDEKKGIAGFECKSITIQATNATRKYFYAPSLYLNPEYDKTNAIGKYNIYLKETSSVFLANTEEASTFIISQYCLKVQPTQIADSVFQLPALPQKKFSIEELITPAEFTRPSGFLKYVSSNLNGEIGAKNIKLRKGEDTASQKVIVRFMVNEYGRVAFAEVENKKDVNPKLAEEALRVVNSSPPWKPAVIYGNEKTVYWFKIPITFMVTKK